MRVMFNPCLGGVVITSANGHVIFASPFSQFARECAQSQVVIRIVVQVGHVPGPFHGDQAMKVTAVM